ncbi:MULTISPECIES: NADH-dependent [FeFe] hydrogenase, group A6 [Halanaerobium]|jgi:iron-only hydrogenase group A|uniref:NAD(P)-dependent iron-only hydrogenase catalytic subunit n=1 Tax=Halanaerobium kushneri TaxID=56779 RepID=A0A1N6W6A2_9FIRM|nr:MULTISPECIES: NADH-dependent [FeFe] hydrogenase, group A6 [Halanaerobium]RCW54235.1 NAD(P)-dependent iron-only hydrogenase catalytic subunit [Halanaerobium sp. ST460_2HS_T2]SIQ85486.1 NAD(P)-dependent iron-only hydrogenase catalytic subunit [Halanaerobium kushneri]
MSKVKLTIDSQTVEVEEDSSLLEAAKEIGIDIPVLCYHPDLSLHGACRVCVVEDEESGRLLASCATPVTEGMKINTRSMKARKARRKNVELLLANHPNDCLGCDRNGHCELQDLTYELGIRSEDVARFAGEKSEYELDTTGPALKRDPNKCILCGRCVRICEEVQGVSALQFTQRGFDSIVTTAFDLPQAEINCVNCGQCATVCPVGAITELSEIDKVWAALEDDEKHVLVQTAPSVQATLGEEFGMEPGTVVTGQMVAALRRLGFDQVFSTDFAADLTILEEGNEFLKKLNGEGELPHITSCCPGWVKGAEHNFPDLLKHLSSAKSPMQMFSALSKTYYPEQTGVDPATIYTVAVMPCTAKKFEKDREEINGSDFKDTDAVLTTREFARMIKEMGINFNSLPEEDFDELMGESTGAGTIFGTTGGVTEAAVRTVKEKLTGEPLERLNLGFRGINQAEVRIGDRLVKVGIANGFANAQKLLERVRAGECELDFIEIMACPHGCVGGGGQPRPATNEKKDKRAQGLANIDDSSKIRKSHENPQILKLYEEFLGEPLGGESHHLLHTKYKARPKN